MFKLNLNYNGEELTPLVFEDFEKAIQAFKDNNKIGIKCTLSNYF